MLYLRTSTRNHIFQLVTGSAQTIQIQPRSRFAITLALPWAWGQIISGGTGTLSLAQMAGQWSANSSSVRLQGYKDSPMNS